MKPPTPLPGKTWADRLREEQAYGRRMHKVRQQYKDYLNEWRGKVTEAYENGAVRGNQPPEWLPYHVKYIKDAD